jgi:hypothetical protein
MFDLNERLLHLAHSLKGVQTEIEGPTERFYRGSPHKPGALFLEVVESGGTTYGLLPHPGCRFHTLAVRPHPTIPAGSTSPTLPTRTKKRSGRASATPMSGPVSLFRCCWRIR